MFHQERKNYLRNQKYLSREISSILRTIDALKEIHVGDYVEFHKGRLGYVEAIIPPDTIFIIENDGTTRSKRIRRFNVK